jgi:hypothetical protein
LTLIIQSVDSRNHVIVAASVTAGLAAAWYEVALLDTLVGLLIALTILKSGLELARDTYRSLEGEEVDLSRYAFGLVSALQQFWRQRLQDWILFLVDRRGITSRAVLTTVAREADDLHHIPAVRALGFIENNPSDQVSVAGLLVKLNELGLLSGDTELRLTDAGQNYIRKRYRWLS